MNFWGDDRGAAIQIGAVILFAFVVIAMASYQATVVPSQNSGVEFNHNQDVQSQMVDLTTGLDASARDGTRGSHSVRLGTTYPSRTFFVNPGSPSGQLRTVESGDIEFSGITVDEADNVQTFWDSRDPITTNRLQYEPNYHAYRSAPTTMYEHGELINDNPRGSPTTLSSGDIVDDGELSLITLRGEVQSASSSTVSVDRRSLSSSANTVTVTNGTITLPIRSDADRYQTYWEQRLAGQDGITNVQTNGATVEFDIDGELDLRMAAVGVGGVTQGEPDDRAAYLYQVNTATVEVRDRFNNPVEGATVEVDGVGETSDDEGQVSVGADRVGDEIDWSINGSTDNEKTLTTTVEESDVGGGTGGSSGTSTYDIAWSDPQPDGNVQSGSTADYEVEQNSGDTFFIAETIPNDINGANVDFYYQDRDGTGISIKSEEGEFTNGDAEVKLGDFNELGEFDLFVASGGHEERITVEVVVSSVKYADRYNDGGNTEGDLPPFSGSAVGSINEFGNMQADDGSPATIVGDGTGPGNDQFDVGTAIDDVEAGTYELQISYEAVKKDTTITVYDDSENQLATTTVTEGIQTVYTTKITVDTDGESVYVRYEGDNPNSELNVEYERIVEQN